MLPIHDDVTRNGDVASAIPVIVAITIPPRRARIQTAIAVKSAKRIGGNQTTRASTSSEAHVAQTLLSVLVLAPIKRAAPPAATSYNGGHGQNAPLTPR